jgi:glycosyl transferase family 25
MKTRHDISCFAINLPKDRARRENIEKEFCDSGLPLTVVEAVNGKALPREHMAEVYDGKRAQAHFRELTVGEIGCALSHLSVYKRIIEGGMPHALVVEDDARLSPAVAPLLESLCDAIPADEPSVTLLTYVKYYTMKAICPLAGGHILTRPVSRHLWLAHGYFVTLEAAKRMYGALYPVWLPADHWRVFEQKKIVAVRAVVPYCIGLSDFAQNSNLEAQRLVRPRHPGRFGDIWQFRVKDQLKKLAWPFLKIRRQEQTW